MCELGVGRGQEVIDAHALGWEKGLELCLVVPLAGVCQAGEFGYVA